MGTGHAVQQAEDALSGFTGNVLILYGDVPFVSSAYDAAAWLTGWHGKDNPAVVVLAFEPEDRAAIWPRVIASDGDDRENG